MDISIVTSNNGRLGGPQGSTTLFALFHRFPFIVSRNLSFWLEKFVIFGSRNLSFWPAEGEETDSLVSALRQFKGVNKSTVVPSGDDATHQRNWDELTSRAHLDGLLASANQIYRAYLLAASASHSGTWLHALLIPRLGLLLNDQSVRISEALRVGLIPVVVVVRLTDSAIMASPAATVQAAFPVTLTLMTW